MSDHTPWDEVRIKNTTTGGEKGSKLARFDLVPVCPLFELAEHYGRGAEKYEDRNWEKGIDWSLSYAALMRHVVAWWGGEDYDEDTGSTHMAAVAWHAFALMEYATTHPELDNRPFSEDDDPFGDGWVEVPRPPDVAWEKPSGLWETPPGATWAQVSDFWDKHEETKETAQYGQVPAPITDNGYNPNLVADEFGYIALRKMEGTPNE